MARRYVQAVIRVESDDDLDDWQVIAAACGAVDGYAVVLDGANNGEGGALRATVTVVVHEELEDE
jgi:hypothetical protein